MTARSRFYVVEKLANEFVPGRFGHDEGIFQRQQSNQMKEMDWENRLPALQGWGKWLAKEMSWALFWAALGFCCLSVLGIL